MKNRTIDEKLFEIIKVLRRKEDASNLCEITGYSRPIIDAALNFGHVKSLDLEKSISKYFTERVQAQKEIIDNIKNILK